MRRHVRAPAGALYTPGDTQQALSRRQPRCRRSMRFQRVPRTHRTSLAACATASPAGGPKKWAGARRFAARSSRAHKRTARVHVASA